MFRLVILVVNVHSLVTTSGRYVVRLAFNCIAFGRCFVVGSVTIGGMVGGVFAVGGGIVMISVVGRLLHNFDPELHPLA